MKKYITILLALCVVSLGFSQTVLKPKEKVYSSQFQKLMKYKLAEKNGSAYVHSSGKISKHVENDAEGILVYETDFGGFRGPNRLKKKGTILAGYKGNEVYTSILFIETAPDFLEILIYNTPIYREYGFLKDTEYDIDTIIENFIEGKTEMKWVMDTL